MDDRVRTRGVDVGFNASSDPALGHLLAVLAASKPGGAVLELGTGVGVGTQSLLRGMDPASRLTTVEKERDLSRVAQDEIDDDRVTWVVEDGAAWLARASVETFDLVFADTWPGKFTQLEEAMALVRPGGFYVVDDLEPMAHWPEEHVDAVERLVATLRSTPNWITVQLGEASGVLICTRL